jgi:hypothetical protein
MSHPPRETDAADEPDSTTPTSTSSTWWNTLRSKLPFGSDADQPDTPASEFTKALSRLIPPDRIEWHDEYTKLDDVYSQTYYISSWPKEAQSHLLYELYTNPQIVFNASVHYNPLSHEAAIDTLVDIEDTLEDKVDGEFSHLIPNVEAQQQTLTAIREMKVNVENDGQRLHELAIYITVYTTQRENLAKIDRIIQQDIREGGGRFGLSIERDLPDLAHLSTAPLAKNALDGTRRRSSQLVLDTAAATTFPLVDDTLIEESGVVVGFNLANETAIVLDLYERDNGYNKLVIGDLGSGKSFGEKQYLLRHRHRHPDDNIIIIDPMSGFEGVNEAIGGEHVKVDGTKTINPLELKPTPDHIFNSTEQIDPYRMKLDEVRWFFRRFFATYLESQENADDLWAPLMRAVKQAYRDTGITNDPATHDNPSPTIRDVLENLQDIADNPEAYTDSTSQVEANSWERRAVDLLMHLEPFREGNELDNLVGETNLEISSAKPTYIDLEAYEGSSQGQQSLMMKLVFSMVYEQIKDTEKRTIVAMDEAHKIIDDSEEADHWEERFRHSRHHDLSIHLISQRFEDFFQSESGHGANEAAKSMADLCTIQQIHRVNDINRPLAKDGLGLTDDHLDYIESAVPGEDDNRPYSTALLKVADKGHYGVKVVATDTEQDLIDFEPAALQDDAETVGNERIEQSLKLQRGLEPDAQEDGALSDTELQTLIQQIPVENLHTTVLDQFIERLLESPDTPYEPADQAFLEHVLYGDHAVTDVLSDIATADTASNDRWETTNPDHNPSPDQSQPHTHDQPATPSEHPRTAPQPSADQAGNTPDGGSDRHDGLPTGPGDAAPGHDLTSPPANNPPESPPDENSPRTTHDPDAPDTDQPDDVFAAIHTTLPAADDATITVSDPISEEKRKECHFIVLDRLSDSHIRALATRYGLPSDLSPQTIKTEIVQTHTDAEIAAGGHDADIEPVRHLKTHVPAESEPPSDAPPAHDVDASETPPASSRALPDPIQGLDVEVPVDTPVSLEKRIECHRTVLANLPDGHRDRLLTTDNPDIGWTGTADATITDLAECYAATEVAATGDTADIHPSHQIKTHYPGTDPDSSP